MGWGAAHAIAEEWSDWCDGPEEAYEILYGTGEDEKLPCPICNKRLSGPDGVIQHMAAKHKKPVHEDAIRAFCEMYGREVPNG